MSMANTVCCDVYSSSYKGGVPGGFPGLRLPVIASMQRSCGALANMRKNERIAGIFLVTLLNGVWGCSFTLVNRCEYEVWPGILSNAGIENFATTGFELPPGSTRVLEAPAGWSGRLWGRTGCTFDSTGNGSCATGDCGGRLECAGVGAAPPASLAEFTLGQGGAKDFYDVSLVDGYNLPVLVSARGGPGTCNATGCIVDLNRSCPQELRVDDVEGSVLACKSACEAFGDAQYCCSGAFGNPNTCKPSAYSQLFKRACPRAYSYAYDDSSSTFTCTAADYTITFCPTMASERKSSATNPSASNDYNDASLDATTGSINHAPRSSATWTLALLLILLALRLVHKDN